MARSNDMPNEHLQIIVLFARAKGATKMTKIRISSGILRMILALLAKIIILPMIVFIIGGVFGGFWCGLALGLIVLWISYGYFTSDKPTRRLRNVGQ